MRGLLAPLLVLAPALAPASEGSPARYTTTVASTRPLSPDRTQDVTQVDGQRLRRTAKPSLLEALAGESADVHVSGRGAFHGIASGATGGIHVRGLGGSPNTQVLVVEDGVPDYQGIFGHPIPDGYAPFLLREAAVIKGGDSVLYGTNALGGVLLLQSRWLDRSGLEVQNDVSLGSFSTMRESFALLGRVGAWDVAGGFQALETHGHRAGTGGGTRVGQAAVRVRLGPALRVTWRNKVVNVKGGDPGPASHPHTGHWFDAWRYTGSAQLAVRAGQVVINVTPYLNAGRHRLHDGFSSLDGVSGAMAEAQWPVVPGLQLVGGVSTERVDGVVENWTHGEGPAVHSQLAVSAYNQLTLRPVRPLTLVVGTRGMVSSVHGPVFLYKGGARWDLFRGFHLRTRVTRNFRQPTLRELYLPYPTANPRLLPEYATNWDLGVGHASAHLEAGASLYRTHATNLIKYFGAWPRAEVVNIDKLTTWGVEGHVAVKRVGPFSAMVGANWQHVGRYTRENPAARVTGRVEAEQEVGPHVVGGTVSGEWVHGLYMANYGRRRIPDVLVADGSLWYRYAPWSSALLLEPYVHLRNITDRRYAYVEGYTMPGFNVMAGVRTVI
jgi:iron complex outermembrane receptor protein